MKAQNEIWKFPAVQYMLLHFHCVALIHQTCKLEPPTAGVYCPFQFVCALLKLANESTVILCHDQSMPSQGMM